MVQLSDKQKEVAINISRNIRESGYGVLSGEGGS